MLLKQLRAEQRLFPFLFFATFEAAMLAAFPRQRAWVVGPTLVVLGLLGWGRLRRGRLARHGRTAAEFRALLRETSTIPSGYLT